MTDNFIELQKKREDATFFRPICVSSPAKEYGSEEFLECKSFDEVKTDSLASFQTVQDKEISDIVLEIKKFCSEYEACVALKKIESEKKIVSEFEERFQSLKNELSAEKNKNNTLTEKYLNLDKQLQRYKTKLCDLEEQHKFCKTAIDRVQCDKKDLEKRHEELKKLMKSEERNHELGYEF